MNCRSLFGMLVGALVAPFRAVGRKQGGEHCFHEPGLLQKGMCGDCRFFWEDLCMTTKEPSGMVGGGICHWGNCCRFPDQERRKSTSSCWEFCPNVWPLADT